MSSLIVHIWHWLVMFFVVSELFFLFLLATVNAMERTETKINIISEQLGLSWAG